MVRLPSVVGMMTNFPSLPPASSMNFSVTSCPSAAMPPPTITSLPFAGPYIRHVGRWRGRANGETQRETGEDRTLLVRDEAGDASHPPLRASRAAGRRATSSHNAHRIEKAGATAQYGRRRRDPFPSLFQAFDDSAQQLLRAAHIGFEPIEAITERRRAVALRGDLALLVQVPEQSHTAKYGVSDLNRVNVRICPCQKRGPSRRRLTTEPHSPTTISTHPTTLTNGTMCPAP